MNDLSELTLTQNEQTEYNKTVRKIPMQTAYNQLQRMLRGDRSQSIRYLQSGVYCSSRLKLNFSIEKRRKERERDELKNALQYKRNRRVTQELDLEAVLNAGDAVDTQRNRQEVQAFFGKLKDGGIDPPSTRGAWHLKSVFYLCLIYYVSLVSHYILMNLSF